jgi:hypothetical protein
MSFRRHVAHAYFVSLAFGLSAAHTVHKPYPGADKDVLRVDVTTEQASPMETLAYYFPVVVKDEATLRIHWGTTVVPIRIKAPFRPNP